MGFTRGWAHVGTIGLLAIMPLAVMAEPYFSVREGMHCSHCHINPTGGGARNVFGNLYAQNQLAAEPLTLPQLWTGELAGLLSIGADARFSASQTQVRGVDTNLDFATELFTFYAAAQVQERLTVYVDQQLAPGGSLNREAWMKLDFGNYYVKAGRIFMPFGWRLQDNSSLVRQISGINMLQGDNGAEFGWQQGLYSAQLAITNGNGGAAERDDGKQFTARVVRSSQHWQIGLSLVDNNTDTLDRSGGGIFAGLNSGPVSWLAEYNHFEDDPQSGLTDELDVALIEANWLIRQGHNLKLSAEHSESDLSRDNQQRYSLVYEFTPYPFVQLRLGYRDNNNDSPSFLQNAEQAFFELHGFF